MKVAEKGYKQRFSLTLEKVYNSTNPHKIWIKRKLLALCLNEC